jgi:putative glycosyltransferase (TIGR04348 family)
MRLSIRIITPVPPGSQRGNRITALRWQSVLRALGQDAVVAEEYGGEPADLLIALHARRSHAAVVRFSELHPDRPLIVALTGTDLYRDLPDDPQARESLRRADRLVVLHALAAEALPEEDRWKTRVIYQSTAVEAEEGSGTPRADRFQVAVIGHLREVKDPFRAAEAARLLPPESRMCVVQAGAALTPEMERRAREEMRGNARYEWVGELPQPDAMCLLAESRLLALTSYSEGGANVIGEAVVRGVPVISTRIPGSEGLLGRDYPGYFPVGDTRELARQLLAAEQDTDWYTRLREQCRILRPLFDPAAERDAWRRLLNELGLQGEKP